MRKVIYTLTGFTIFCYSLNVYCQDTSSLQRKTYKLHIDVNRKTFYEEDLPAGRFVHPNNAVQLYPGESVYLEADVAGAKIIKIRAVPAIKDSAKTITASFEQISKNKVHEQMMLKVYNPFQQKLVYKAKMYVLNGNNWTDTSILPVEAGLWGYEMWNDIIVSIAIGDWALE